MVTCMQWSDFGWSSGYCRGDRQGALRRKGVLERAEPGEIQGVQRGPRASTAALGLLGYVYYPHQFMFQTAFRKKYFLILFSLTGKPIPAKPFLQAPSSRSYLYSLQNLVPNAFFSYEHEPAHVRLHQLILNSKAPFIYPFLAVPTT